MQWLPKFLDKSSAATMYCTTEVRLNFFSLELAVCQEPEIKTSLQKELHYVGDEAFGIVVNQFCVRLFFCFEIIYYVIKHPV